jgi:photosystem II stability/assembly factor-like uncharacterized protein
MKKLLIFILFSFTIITTLKAQWEPCNNGLGGDLIFCFIIDGKNTFAGIDGGVFMTTDNGDNWIAKNNGLNGFYPLHVSSLAISGNNIYAGTLRGGIFLSAEKGDKWVRKSNGLTLVNGRDTLFLESVSAIIIYGKNIFAGTLGGNNGVYLSSDNGDNWTAKNNGLPKLDSFIHIESMAINGNNIYAGTDSGVYLSTDNGNNWFAKNKGIENFAVFSLAINGNNIYAGTSNGLFLSTDIGDNWKNIGMKDNLIDALIIKGNYIVAGGYGIYLSTDQGNNWTAKNSGLTDLAVTSMIINGDYIFVGTTGIFRAKLSELGITDVKEQEQINEIKILPNPASGDVKLKFESTNISRIQISVFDLLGKEVFSSYDDCNIGMNEKVMDCRSLNTGYYIIRLKQKDRVEAKPLLILK